MKFLPALLPLSALMLAGCSYDRGDGGVNSASNQARPLIYNYDGAYRMIPAPKRLWETPLDIAGHFIKGHPESVEGKPGFEARLVDRKRGDGQLTLLITAIGYLDDSVRGDQWRVNINNTGRGWGIITAENRFMCQRGPDEGKWVIKPCP